MVCFERLIINKASFDGLLNGWVVFFDFFKKRGCQVLDDLYNAASLTRQMPQGFGSNQ